MIIYFFHQWKPNTITLWQELLRPEMPIFLLACNDGVWESGGTALGILKVGTIL